jgi:GH35 family endo-1,4-beta-xylanase
VTCGDTAAARFGSGQRKLANHLTETAANDRAVKAVLTWGMTDAHTWLNGIKSHKERQPNRSQRPLPFDENYQSSFPISVEF